MFESQNSSYTSCAKFLIVFHFFCFFCFIGLASVPSYANQTVMVGVSMPTKSSLRWIRDGNELTEALKKKGYSVDLQYAEDDIPNQIAQIENMITRDVKVLVIAPVDDLTLTPVLEQAQLKGISVISYDRLIRNSSAVDYYITFDNFKVGMLQAQSILEGLGYPNKKGPFTLELFAGSPDDGNSFFFYDGAMSVFNPLIDEGTLVIKSGQVGMKKVGTLRWSIETAQARMDNILSAYYSDGTHVDAVLSPTDFLSRSIISSLKGIGYGSPTNPWPIVSGQDCEVPSIISIIKNEQYSTIFKDSRQLAQKTADLVEHVLSGDTKTLDNTKPYDNGIKVVPSILMNPILVTKSNYKEILMDSGYVKQEELGNVY